MGGVGWRNRRHIVTLCTSLKVICHAGGCTEETRKTQLASGCGGTELLLGKQLVPSADHKQASGDPELISYGHCCVFTPVERTYTIHTFVLRVYL